ncbi:MAG: STAS domain-containing protein [Planctomycetota bacterium]|jgi:anti-sigma B factor antagonist
MTNEPIVDVSIREDVYVVSFNQPSICGVAQVDTIADTLRSLIRDRRPENLVIDFSDVVFFSSQMLGLLVDLWRRMKDANGKLLVSGINTQLTRVFRITHLDKIFDFYENSQAAVSAIHA